MAVSGRTDRKYELSESTDWKQNMSDQVAKPWLFQPGQSGNSKGQPKGTRNKLSEAFLHDLRDCWSRRGIQVLEEVATKEPAKLLAAMVQLMPKDVLIAVNDNRPMIELTAEELLAIAGPNNKAA